MRTFETYDEAASEIKRDLKELSVIYQSRNVQDQSVSDDPGYLTHELSHYAYSILDATSIWDEVTEAEERYWKAEFKERTGFKPLNPGLAWEYDKDYWQQFLHEGQFSYTYAERMHQLNATVLRTLSEDNNTRRAWLSIWDPMIDTENMGLNMARVPCSLGYGLQIRQGKLSIHYIMRSCDFITHWRKDVSLAVMYQNMASEYCGVELGTFHHTIFSLHAFAKDLEGVF